MEKKTEILLISEDTIKDNSAVSDNVAGKYIRAAIRAAQETSFRSLVGDALLGKLKDLVRDDEIDEAGNAAYKALLDVSQYYLLYTSLVELIPVVTVKIANAGAVKTPDEKVEVVSQEQVSLEQERYQGKADMECRRIQDYLLNNRAAYPELSECDCRRIHANLYSAASSGIFLGGARGRRLPNPAK